MSTGTEISALYRELTDALTEVLAENAVGPARRGRAQSRLLHTGVFVVASSPLRTTTSMRQDTSSRACAVSLLVPQPTRNSALITHHDQRKMSPPFGLMHWPW